MVAESHRSRREPHWVTPRLALLRDGRLAMTCDLDDYEHSHEYQEPGIYVWWSTDLGQTWSSPENTGILGIEPDRIIELPDGRLSMGSHFLPAETQKHAEHIWRSADGGGPGAPAWRWPGTRCTCTARGPTSPSPVAPCCACCGTTCTTTTPPRWPSPSTTAKPGRPPWRPPSRGTARSSGSSKTGASWSPSATREATGAPTPGWGRWTSCISTGYRVSALHLGPEEISLSAGEGLRITHRRPATTQYNLLPPESYRSEVLFDAHVRVESISGAPDERCALVQLAHVNVRLTLAPNGLYLSDFDSQPRLIDRHYPADLTRWRRLRVHHTAGLVRVYLDGQDALRFRLPAPGPFISTCFGSPRDGTGTSCWQTVSYLTRNQTEPEHCWVWDARSGQYPDQYELDRLLELHPNTHERPDNGYSSWLPLAGGEILVLDYTNQDDPLGQSHIVGCRLRAEDFQTMGRRA